MSPASSAKRYAIIVALLLCLVPLMIWHHYIACIPLPSNIELVPGYLQWEHNQWAMDLQTGQISWRTNPDSAIYKAGKRIGIEFLSATKELAVTVQKVDAQSPLDSTSDSSTASSSASPAIPTLIDMWGRPEILSGRYLVLESRGQLLAVDLESEKTPLLKIAIPPVQNSGGRDALFLLEGTNRFIRDNSSSGADDMSLYEIGPDELRLVATWDGVGAIGYADGKLYVCPRNSKQIEVRSEADGSLLETIPLPDTAGAISGNVQVRIWQDVLLMTDNRLDYWLAFDLRKRAIMDLPHEGCGPPILTDRSPYIIQRCRRPRLGHDLLIYDRHSEKVIQEIVSPLSGCHFSVQDERHLLFTSHAHGVSAVIVDMETGREVKRWTPYGRLSWSTLLFCPLIILWIVAWCWNSAKARLWAWLDIFLIGTLLAVMAAYRIERSTITSAASGLAFSTILLCVIQCAGWWGELSRTKLITTTSLLLLCVGLAQSFYAYAVAMSETEQRWALLIAAVLCLAYVLGMAHMARRKGHRIVKQGSTASRISVLDYMLLTVAMAVCINALRLTMDLPDGDIDGAFVLHVSWPALLSIAGLAAGFSNRKEMFWSALSLATLAVLVIVGAREIELLTGESPVRIFQRGTDPSTIESEVYNEVDEFILHCVIEGWLIGLFGPFLFTIPLRLRGWRSALLSTGRGPNGVDYHLSQAKLGGGRIES